MQLISFQRDQLIYTSSRMHLFSYHSVCYVNPFLLISTHTSCEHMLMKCVESIAIYIFFKSVGHEPSPGGALAAFVAAEATQSNYTTKD